MDHGRKIGKTEQPFPWKKSPSPPCSISDKPLIGDDELTEDRRLKNWRKWLVNRKKHYRRYKAETHRDYENLIINTSDKFRRTVEMKNLMESAGDALAKKVDKYRGDPSFWQTPEFLPKHGNSDLPDISITLTKKQRKVAPHIERVGLPELIYQEKGLPFRNDQKPLSKCTEYFETRTALQSRKIKLLQIKEPDFDQLSVKGQRLGQAKSENPKIPIITIAGTEVFESSAESDVEQKNTIVLKIQDRVFKFGEVTNDKNIDHFTLMFRSSSSMVVERKIRLQNRGTCAITYCWRYGSLGSTLIPSGTQSSAFFFNKNEDILLPGQITVLRVWFRSRVPYSTMEFWTLITDPQICLAPLIFRFWGCCSSAASNKDDASLSVYPTSIDQYIGRRIRDAAIGEIIREIVDNIRTTNLPSPAYKSLFVESEVFRAKNSSYYYHPGVIQKLKNIHNNATSSDSPAWSLSLDDLRDVILQLKMPQVRYEALIRFNELCRDCLVPSLYNSAENSKISMVHNLLCCFANKFEAEIDNVRAKCSRGEYGARTRSVTQGDSRSTSVSRLSQVSQTSQRKSRKISRPGQSTRTTITSKTSILTPTNRDSFAPIPSSRSNESECRLYKEVLYVRIREMLGETIGDICGIVDTINNLSGHGK